MMYFDGKHGFVKDFLKEQRKLLNPLTSQISKGVKVLY